MNNLIKFKPAIILVDNEDQVIKALVSELSGDFELLSFNDPAESIDQIIEASENKMTCEIQNSLSGNEFFSKKIIDKSWCYYNAIVVNKMKFNICIISDYEMPFINGITLLEKIQSKVKKVLLTGVFTMDKAIDALNCDKIDAYVEKGLGSFNKIQEVVDRFAEQFFLRESRFDCVNIPSFITDLLKKSKEFFVIDSDGSSIIDGDYYHVVSLSDVNTFSNIIPSDMVSLKKKVNDLEIIPFLTDIPDDSLRIKEYMFSNFSIEHKSDEKVIVKISRDEFQQFSKSFQGEHNDG